MEQQGATGNGPVPLTGGGGRGGALVALVLGSRVAAMSGGSAGSFSRRSAMAASDVAAPDSGALQPIRIRTSNTATAARILDLIDGLLLPPNRVGPGKGY